MKSVSLVILISCVLLLGSCTPPHTLYLRNFLYSDVLVELKFENRKDLDTWLGYGSKLPLRKNVTKFDKMKGSFRNHVKAVVISDSLAVQYSLPARSMMISGSAKYFTYAQAIVRGKQAGKTYFLLEGEELDNITGERTKMELGYQWLGKYFFDIK